MFKYRQSSLISGILIYSGSPPNPDATPLYQFTILGPCIHAGANFFA